MANNTTPGSGRFLGLINRFRSPSQGSSDRSAAPSSSLLTPNFLQRNMSKSSFALTNASSSTINSFASDTRGSPAPDLDYLEYEDVPMPVFECDWMNEEDSGGGKALSPSAVMTNRNQQTNSTLASTSNLISSTKTMPPRPASPRHSPPIPSLPSSSSLRNYGPIASSSGTSSAQNSGGYSPSGGGTSGVDSSGDRMRRAVMMGGKGRNAEGDVPGEGGLRSLARGWTKSKEALVKLRSPTPVEVIAAPVSVVEEKISPTFSSSLNRHPLHRNPSADRVLSASQPASSLASDTVTPALSRPGLMSKRIGAKWKPPTAASTGKPLRRATRVPVAELARAADDEANEGASEGGESQSPDAPDESLTAPTPSLQHSRSRSDIPPASPRFDGVDSAKTGAATVTISSSAYLNRTRRPLPSQPVFEQQRTADSSADFSPPVDGDRRPLGASIRSRQPLKPTTVLHPRAKPSPEIESESRYPSNSSQVEHTPPRLDRPELMRRESKEVRRTQVFEETAAKLAQAGPSRVPMEEPRRSASAMSSYTTANYYPTDSPPPSRRSSVELRTGEREATMMGNGSSSRGGIYRDGSDNMTSGERATATLRQVRPAPSQTRTATNFDSTRTQTVAGRPTPPLQYSRQPLEPEQQYQDENQENPYESRSTARKPISTPSYQPSLSHSVSTSRPILGEIHRPTNTAHQLPPSPPRSNHHQSSSSRSQYSYPSDGRHEPPSDFQIPLRDGSPGAAEMTPSINYREAHYQSQGSQQSQLQQPAQYSQQQSSQQPAPAPRSTKERKNYFVVHGKKYSRIDVIGKGGSSKVWRVISDTGGIFALKQVSIRAHDAETRASFVNEITLLEKLRGHPQIINLIASDMTEKSLQMVLELGEVDLNVLLCGHLAKPISMNFIRYIFEQMLEAVQVIHNEEVVHTDLKPANFVLVKGCLKLIDFGISKAIANDTTNIGRDQQVGTANYMPPEALLDSGMGDGGKRLMKLGKPSDVWSLGCILYQMVYSYTPFSIYKDISRKIINIQNPSHVIHFPDMAIPLDAKGVEKGHLAVRVGDDLKEAMRSCLRWDPKKRAKIPELLKGEFLRGKEVVPVVKTTPTFEVDEELMTALTQRMAVMLRGKRLSPDDAITAAQKLFKEGLDAQALAKSS